MAQSQVKTTKDGKFWRKQIELSLTTRAFYERWWECNLKAYAPQGDPEAYGEDVRTNRTFTTVERKKADLFYQKPDVTLQPTPLMDGPIAGVNGPPDPTTGLPMSVPQSVGVQAHQEIVNEKLGDDGIDATEMMDAVLFDIIATQGVGFTEMGYESITVPVDQEVVDPATGLPRVQKVPVPIHEHCFWHHFSGKQALIPHNFRSTNWDRAPWLGRQFELPLTVGNRQKYQLPPEFSGSKPADKKQHYEHGAETGTADEVFTGCVIWYRSALYREDRLHPEHMTLLILVDGIDEPVIHQDSPYQTLLPNGQLSPDSLIGNPIHPFSVRKLTDSAYVPSDGTMIRPLEAELDVSRKQRIQFRDAATLKWVYNTDVLPKDALGKIVRSPIGGMIGVPGEAFHGEGAIKDLPQGTIPRENIDTDNQLDNDIARTVSIDSAGAGVQSTTSQTATETQVIAANANARLDKERGIILKRYLRGVTKFSTLLQRYLPVQQAAEIVGPERAQIWDAWRRQVPSALAFTALPDSALRVDQAVDRKAALDLYSFLANEPYAQKGRAKLLEKLLRKHHIDPTDIVAPPDPPKPEPPKLAFSFKGEDLVGPQAPIVLGIAEQLGLKIDPAWVTLSQGLLMQAQEQAAAEAAEQEGQEGDTKHGGKAAQAESLDKHHAQESGAMQGIGGAPTPMGAGGMIQ